MARPPSGQIIARHGKTGVSYGIRFRAGGQRHYVTTKAVNRAEAEEELSNVLADVRRRIWRPSAPEPVTVVDDPGFHAFASAWVQERTAELRPRSIEALMWALTNHLLPFFKDHRLSQITMAEVDRYRFAKVRERDAKTTPEDGRPMGNRSINATIAVLAQVLGSAIEDGHVTGANPARGRRRRLKAEKPRRTWLELDELRALLDAAGDHRPLIAVMALGGLRVGEATALLWGHVDLPNGRLQVLDSKTAAGRRTVDLSPTLAGELRALKAKVRSAGPDELVFHTREGRQRNRHNVRANVLATAIKAANKRLAEQGKPPIQTGVTKHSLRRTFASLLYEAKATPAYVMGQMGHTSSSLALEVYARMMSRDRDTGARVDALLGAPDWAQTGTNEPEELLVEAESL